MVPFAGWEMPVQYEGIIQEHRAVRADAGVFDVSHMGEVEVEGPRAHELLQGLLSNDLDRIGTGEAQYTLLTNERGGIVDDLIAYRLDGFRYLLVVNASNRDADYAWLKGREITGSDVRDVSDEYALRAVQGPRALERLGLGNILSLSGVEPVTAPVAAYGRMRELSAGKDTTTGHWELAGVIQRENFTSSAGSTPSSTALPSTGEGRSSTSIPRRRLIPAPLP